MTRAEATELANYARTLRDVGSFLLTLAERELSTIDLRARRPGARVVPVQLAANDRENASPVVVDEVTQQRVRTLRRQLYGR